MDLEEYAGLISQRLSELGARMQEIDHELGLAKDSDLEEQAIDLEDDEVLEGLGIAAQQEVASLRQAQIRIQKGTYGICQSCQNPIDEERLKAVLYTPLCRNCAQKL